MLEAGPNRVPPMHRLAVLCLLCLLGCGNSREAPAKAPPPIAATPATPPTPAPVAVTEADATGPDTWTTAAVDLPAPTGGMPALVASVRSASHEGFDRIVLEFKGDRVPGHHIAYIDRPARDCTAGAEVTIDGEGLLLVQLSAASAHDDAGGSTSAKEEKPALANVREIERTCDHEGVVAFVVGLGSPNPFRVFALAAPPRLVVDVRK